MHELSALMDECKTNSDLDALLLRVTDSPKKILGDLIISYRDNFDDLENLTPDPLPEKVIVSAGCHCCILQSKNDKGFEYCIIIDEWVQLHIDDESRHPQCPLLTHTIKVVKND